MTEKDTLYSEPLDVLNDWQFNAQVASVFPDMVKRSIPGYASILSSIGQFAARFVVDHSAIYDLGCSLGAVTLAIRRQVTAKECTLYAIDNSEAMVARCQTVLNQYRHNSLTCHVLCDDICQVPIENASFVVLNFTLQFIEPERRMALIQSIYDGLRPGGALIVSEKFRFQDESIEALYCDMHYDFKRAHGYSELEISQKRTMLENVMRLDTQEIHHERLASAGFTHIAPWYQCLNFGSILAIK